MTMPTSGLWLMGVQAEMLILKSMGKVVATPRHIPTVMEIFPTGPLRVPWLPGTTYRTGATAPCTIHPISPLLFRKSSPMKTGSLTIPWLLSSKVIRDAVVPTATISLKITVICYLRLWSLSGWKRNSRISMSVHPASWV